MTAGLTVRLQTARRDVHVTRQVEDLTFRTTVPGGYASCSIALQRPLNVTPDELQYFGRLYVYDGRNGNTVWEGRVENLGRGADSGGQVWSVDAVGSMAHAQDFKRPLIYQDLDLGSWQPAKDAPVWLDLQQINTSAYGAGLQIHAPRGTPVPVGTWTAWEYVAMQKTGFTAAAINFLSGEDVTDTKWVWTMGAPVLGGITSTFTAGSAVNRHITFGPFTSGTIPLILERDTSAVTVADDLTAASFVNIAVRGALFDKATGATSADMTLYNVPLSSTMVVADLLGRLLPRFDGTNALIDTTTVYQFVEQLSYPSGATAADVLNDLMTLIPSYYWAAWETNPATSKARFEWKPWPTTVRYYADARDGFNSPGTASNIYDTVTARWVDPTGRNQAYSQTVANPVLDAAGIHRSNLIDLGSAIGGSTAATRTVQQALAQNAAPTSSGTLTVARPVFDKQLGHMVQPWEILPGYLIRVREVAPGTTGDSDRDGVSTFRIVAANYAQSSNTATLELDAPALNLTNQIARVVRGVLNPRS